VGEQLRTGLDGGVKNNHNDPPEMMLMRVGGREEMDATVGALLVKHRQGEAVSSRPGPAHSLAFFWWIVMD
jgi:hypothetical protein